VVECAVLETRQTGNPKLMTALELLGLAKPNQDQRQMIKITDGYASRRTLDLSIKSLMFIQRSQSLKCKTWDLVGFEVQWVRSEV
jgi:hypothetical protein